MPAINIDANSIITGFQGSKKLCLLFGILQVNYGNVEWHYWPCLEVVAKNRSEKIVFFGWLVITIIYKIKKNGDLNLCRIWSRLEYPCKSKKNFWKSQTSIFSCWLSLNRSEEMSSKWDRLFIGFSDRKIGLPFA